MESYLQQIIDQVGPLVVTIVGAAVALAGVAVSAFVPWAVYQIKEKFRLDAKTGNAASLNRTVEYATKAAAVEVLGSASPASGTRPSIQDAGAVIADLAVEKIRENNPDPVAALGETDQTLREKVLARIVPAMAEITEGQARIRASARN